MAVPELRGLLSPDLERPALPPDPRDCGVFFQALIGPKGEQGSEAFGFTAATPAYVDRLRLPRWGHGLLLVDEFSWKQLDRTLERLLAHATRDTWQQVVGTLRQTLEWEFENYQSQGLG